MKWLMAIMLAASLYGIDYNMKVIGELKTGRMFSDVKVVCINGVQYFMGGIYNQGYMSPVYNTNGKIKTCKGE